MSYRLALNTNSEQEIKRIIRERFQKSYEAFSDEQKDLDYAVHQLRKNMKKARAALRLVRDVIGKSYYKDENRAARDIARTAAELRKQYVMIEVMNKMNERFHPGENNRFYPTVYQTLEIRHKELKEKLISSEDFVNQTVYKLHETENEIENLSFDEESFDAFTDGLKRVYKRGRKAKKNAQKNPTTENFHEWRKRAKYLRYQLRILRNIWPGVLKAYIKELHELSDLLGDDHDLQEFKNQLQQVFHSEEYSDWLQELEPLIEEFSNEKRAAALELGDKIYIEKPRDFIKRIEKYWKVANG